MSHHLRMRTMAVAVVLLVAALSSAVTDATTTNPSATAAPAGPATSPSPTLSQYYASSIRYSVMYRAAWLDANAVDNVISGRFDTDTALQHIVKFPYLRSGDVNSTGTVSNDGTELTFSSPRVCSDDDDDDDTSYDLGSVVEVWVCSVDANGDCDEQTLMLLPTAQTSGPEMGSSLFVAVSGPCLLTPYLESGLNLGHVDGMYNPQYMTVSVGAQGGQRLSVSGRYLSDKFTYNVTLIQQHYETSFDPFTGQYTYTTVNTTIAVLPTMVDVASNDQIPSNISFTMPRLCFSGSRNPIIMHVNATCIVEYDEGGIAHQGDNGCVSGSLPSELFFSSGSALGNSDAFPTEPWQQQLLIEGDCNATMPILEGAGTVSSVFGTWTRQGGGDTIEIYGHGFSQSFDYAVMLIEDDMYSMPPIGPGGNGTSAPHRANITIPATIESDQMLSVVMPMWCPTQSMSRLTILATCVRPLVGTRSANDNDGGINGAHSLRSKVLQARESSPAVLRSDKPVTPTLADLSQLLSLREKTVAVGGGSDKRCFRGLNGVRSAVLALIAPSLASVRGRVSLDLNGATTVRLQIGQGRRPAISDVENEFLISFEADRRVWSANVASATSRAKEQHIRVPATPSDCDGVSTLASGVANAATVRLDSLIAALPDTVTKISLDVGSPAADSDLTLSALDGLGPLASRITTITMHRSQDRHEVDFDDMFVRQVANRMGRYGFEVRKGDQPLSLLWHNQHAEDIAKLSLIDRDATTKDNADVHRASKPTDVVNGGRRLLQTIGGDYAIPVDPTAPGQTTVQVDCSVGTKGLLPTRKVDPYGMYMSNVYFGVAHSAQVWHYGPCSDAPIVSTVANHVISATGGPVSIYGYNFDHGEYLVVGNNGTGVVFSVLANVTSRTSLEADIPPVCVPYDYGSINVQVYKDGVALQSDWYFPDIYNATVYVIGDCTMLPLRDSWADAVWSEGPVSAAGGDRVVVRGQLPPGYHYSFQISIPSTTATLMPEPGWEQSPQDVDTTVTGPAMYWDDDTDDPTLSFAVPQFCESNYIAIRLNAQRCHPVQNTATATTTATVAATTTAASGTATGMPAATPATRIGSDCTPDDSEPVLTVQGAMMDVIWDGWTGTYYDGYGGYYGGLRPFEARLRLAGHCNGQALAHVDMFEKLPAAGTMNVGPPYDDHHAFPSAFFQPRGSGWKADATYSIEIRSNNVSDTVDPQAITVEAESFRGYYGNPLFRVPQWCDGVGFVVIRENGVPIFIDRSDDFMYAGVQHRSLKKVSEPVHFEGNCTIPLHLTAGMAEHVDVFTGASGPTVVRGRGLNPLVYAYEWVVTGGDARVISRGPVTSWSYEWSYMGYGYALYIENLFANIDAGYSFFNITLSLLARCTPIDHNRVSSVPSGTAGAGTAATAPVSTPDSTHTTAAAPPASSTATPPPQQHGCTADSATFGSVIDAHRNPIVPFMYEISGGRPFPSFWGMHWPSHVPASGGESVWLSGYDLADSFMHQVVFDDDRVPNVTAHVWSNSVTFVSPQVCGTQMINFTVVTCFGTPQSMGHYTDPSMPYTDPNMPLPDGPTSDPTQDMMCKRPVPIYSGALVLAGPCIQPPFIAGSPYPFSVTSAGGHSVSIPGGHLTSRFTYEIVFPDVNVTVPITHRSNFALSFEMPAICTKKNYAFFHVMATCLAGTETASDVVDPALIYGTGGEALYTETGCRSGPVMSYYDEGSNNLGLELVGDCVNGTLLSSSQTASDPYYGMMMPIPAVYHSFSSVVDAAGGSMIYLSGTHLTRDYRYLVDLWVDQTANYTDRDSNNQHYNPYYYDNSQAPLYSEVMTAGTPTQPQLSVPGFVDDYGYGLTFLMPAWCAQSGARFAIRAECSGGTGSGDTGPGTDPGFGTSPAGTGTTFRNNGAKSSTSREAQKDNERPHRRPTRADIRTQLAKAQSDLPPIVQSKAPQTSPISALQDLLTMRLKPSTNCFDKPGGVGSAVLALIAPSLASVRGRVSLDLNGATTVRLQIGQGRRPAISDDENEFLISFEADRRVWSETVSQLKPHASRWVSVPAAASECDGTSKTTAGARAATVRLDSLIAALPDTVTKISLDIGSQGLEVDHTLSALQGASKLLMRLTTVSVRVVNTYPRSVTPSNRAQVVKYMLSLGFVVSNDIVDATGRESTIYFSNSSPIFFELQAATASRSNENVKTDADKEERVPQQSRNDKQPRRGRRLLQTSNPPPPPGSTMPGGSNPPPITAPSGTDYWGDTSYNGDSGYPGYTTQSGSYATSCQIGTSGYLTTSSYSYYSYGDNYGPTPYYQEPPFIGNVEVVGACTGEATVTSMSPESVGAWGGDNMTIYGLRFSPNATYSIGAATPGPDGVTLFQIDAVIPYLDMTMPPMPGMPSIPGYGYDMGMGLGGFTMLVAEMPPICASTIDEKGLVLTLYEDGVAVKSNDDFPQQFHAPLYVYGDCHARPLEGAFITDSYLDPNQAWSRMDGTNYVWDSEPYIVFSSPLASGGETVIVEGRFPLGYSYTWELSMAEGDALGHTDAMHLTGRADRARSRDYYYGYYGQLDVLNITLPPMCEGISVEIRLFAQKCIGDFGDDDMYMSSPPPPGTLPPQTNPSFRRKLLQATSDSPPQTSPPASYGPDLSSQPSFPTSAPAPPPDSTYPPYDPYGPNDPYAPSDANCTVDLSAPVLSVRRDPQRCFTPYRHRMPLETDQEQIEIPAGPGAPGLLPIDSDIGAMTTTVNLYVLQQSFFALLYTASLMLYPEHYWSEYYGSSDSCPASSVRQYWDLAFRSWTIGHCSGKPLVSHFPERLVASGTQDMVDHNFGVYAPGILEASDMDYYEQMYWSDMYRERRGTLAYIEVTGLPYKREYMNATNATRQFVIEFRSEADASGESSVVRVNGTLINRYQIAFVIPKWCHGDAYATVIDHNGTKWYSRDGLRTHGTASHAMFIGNCDVPINTGVGSLFAMMWGSPPALLDPSTVLLQLVGDYDLPRHVTYEYVIVDANGVSSQGPLTLEPQFSDCMYSNDFSVVGDDDEDANRGCQTIPFLNSLTASVPSTLWRRGATLSVLASCEHTLPPVVDHSMDVMPGCPWCELPPPFAVHNTTDPCFGDAAFGYVPMKRELFTPFIIDFDEAVPKGSLAKAIGSGQLIIVSSHAPPHDIMAPESSVTTTLKLSLPAPPGGIEVSVEMDSSSIGAFSLPTVVFAEGSMEANLTLVAGTTPGHIELSLAPIASETASLVMEGVTFWEMTVVAMTVSGVPAWTETGSSFELMVQLSIPAAQDHSVGISLSSGAADVDALSIDAGMTSAAAIVTMPTTAGTVTIELSSILCAGSNACSFAVACKATTHLQMEQNEATLYTKSPYVVRFTASQAVTGSELVVVFGLDGAASLGASTNPSRITMAAGDAASATFSINTGSSSGPLTIQVAFEGADAGLYAVAQDLTVAVIPKLVMSLSGVPSSLRTSAPSPTITLAPPPGMTQGQSVTVAMTATSLTTTYTQTTFTSTSTAVTFTVTAGATAGVGVIAFTLSGTSAAIFDDMPTHTVVISDRNAFTVSLESASDGRPGGDLWVTETRTLTIAADIVGTFADVVVTITPTGATASASAVTITAASPSQTVSITALDVAGSGQIVFSHSSTEFSTPEPVPITVELGTVTLSAIPDFAFVGDASTFTFTLNPPLVSPNTMGVNVLSTSNVVSLANLPSSFTQTSPAATITANVAGTADVNFQLSGAQAALYAVIPTVSILVADRNAISVTTQSSNTFIHAGDQLIFTAATSAEVPPIGDVVITVTASGTSETTMTVTLASGQSSAAFALTASPVASSITLSFSISGLAAEYYKAPATWTATVHPRGSVTIGTFDSALFEGGLLTVPVALSTALPTAGGLIVETACSDETIAVTSNAVFAASTASSSFVVASIGNAGTITITLAVNGINANGYSMPQASTTITLTIQSRPVIAITMDNVLFHGESAAISFTLPVPVPDGTLSITAMRTDTFVTSTASCTAGTTSCSTTMPAGDANATAAIQVFTTGASREFYATPADVPFEVMPPGTATVIGPTVIKAGSTSSDIVVTLPSAVPAGESLTLTTTVSSLATASASSIEFSATTASFSVTAGSTTGTFTVSFALTGTASRRYTSPSSLTVNIAAKGTVNVDHAATLSLGSSTEGTCTLSSPTSTAITVSVTSDIADMVLTTAVIAAGASSAKFSITGGATSGTATLSYALDDTSNYDAPASTSMVLAPGVIACASQENVLYVQDEIQFTCTPQPPFSDITVPTVRTTASDLQLGFSGNAGSASSVVTTTLTNGVFSVTVKIGASHGEFNFRPNLSGPMSAYYSSIASERTGTVAKQLPITVLQLPTSIVVADGGSVDFLIALPTPVTDDVTIAITASGVAGATVANDAVFAAGTTRATVTINFAPGFIAGTLALSYQKTGPRSSIRVLEVPVAGTVLVRPKGTIGLSTAPTFFTNSTITRSVTVSTAPESGQALSVYVEAVGVAGHTVTPNVIEFTSSESKREITVSSGSALGDAELVFTLFGSAALSYVQPANDKVAVVARRTMAVSGAETSLAQSATSSDITIRVSVAPANDMTIAFNVDNSLHNTLAAVSGTPAVTSVTIAAGATTSDPFKIDSGSKSGVVSIAYTVTASGSDAQAYASIANTQIVVGGNVQVTVASVIPFTQASQVTVVVSPAPSETLVVTVAKESGVEATLSTTTLTFSPTVTTATMDITGGGVAGAATFTFVSSLASHADAKATTFIGARVDTVSTDAALPSAALSHAIVLTGLGLLGAGDVTVSFQSQAGTGPTLYVGSTANQASTVLGTDVRKTDTSIVATSPRSTRGQVMQVSVCFTQLGGHCSLSAPFTVVGQIAPTGAAFSANFRQVVVQLSQDTDKASTMPNAANNALCVQALSSATLALAGASDASCHWRSPDVFAISIQTSSSLTVGNTIAFSDSFVVRNKDGSPPGLLVSTATATVSAPDVLPVVETILVGPSQLGPCTSLQMNVADSKGAAGRPWADVSWSMTATTASGVTVDSFKTLMSSHSSVHFDRAHDGWGTADGTLPNGVYTFVATLTNWLGTTASSSPITVTVTSDRVPSISLNINGQHSDELGNNDFFIKATTSPATSCAGNVVTTEVVDVAWTVATSAGVAVDVSALELTVRHLKIARPALYFDNGATYTFTCTATQNGVSASKSVDITFAVSAPRLRIEGGNSRKASTSFIVDASKTIDSNAKLESEFQSGFTFAWACATLSVDGVFVPAATCPTHTTDTYGVMDVTRGVAGAIYQITVTASKHGVSASQSVEIEVLEQQPVDVAIIEQTTASSAVMISSTDAVVFESETSAVDVQSYVWSIDGVATLTFNSWLAAGGAGQSLKLKANSLSPGQVYTVRLSVVANDVYNTIGEASATITVHEVPAVGSFVITPTEGVSLTTVFTLTADGFSLSDGSNDFSYDFMAHDPEDPDGATVTLGTVHPVFDVIVGSGGTSQVKTTLLGVGTAVNCQVRVCTAVGTCAFASASRHPVVTPATWDQTVAAAETLLGDAENGGGSAERALATVTVASALKKSKDLGDNAAEVAMRIVIAKRCVAVAWNGPPQTLLPELEQISQMVDGILSLDELDLAGLVDINLLVDRTAASLQQLAKPDANVLANLRTSSNKIVSRIHDLFESGASDGGAVATRRRQLLSLTAATTTALASVATIESFGRDVSGLLLDVEALLVPPSAVTVGQTQYQGVVVRHAVNVNRTMSAPGHRLVVSDVNNPSAIYTVAPPSDMLARTTISNSGNSQVHLSAIIFASNPYVSIPNASQVLGKVVTFSAYDVNTNTLCAEQPGATACRGVGYGRAFPAPISVTALVTPVTFTIPRLAMAAPGKYEYCAWFNPAKLDFDTSGCRWVSNTTTTVDCACTHLTSFSIIQTDSPVVPEPLVRPAPSTPAAGNSFIKGSLKLEGVTTSTFVASQFTASIASFLSISESNVYIDSVSAVSRRRNSARSLLAAGVEVAYVIEAASSSASSLLSTLEAGAASGALITTMNANGMPVTGVSITVPATVDTPVDTTPPTPAPKDDDDDDGPPVGAIIGGVCGGVALIGIGVGAFVFMKKRRGSGGSINTPYAEPRKPQTKPASSSSPAPVPAPVPALPKPNEMVAIKELQAGANTPLVDASMNRVMSIPDVSRAPDPYQISKSTENAWKPYNPGGNGTPLPGPDGQRMPFIPAPAPAVGAPPSYSNTGAPPSYSDTGAPPSYSNTGGVPPYSSSGMSPTAPSHLSSLDSIPDTAARHSSARLGLQNQINAGLVSNVHAQPMQQMQAVGHAPAPMGLPVGANTVAALSAAPPTALSASQAIHRQ